MQMSENRQLIDDFETNGLVQAASSRRRNEVAPMCTIPLRRGSRSYIRKSGFQELPPDAAALMLRVHAQKVKICHPVSLVLQVHLRTKNHILQVFVSGPPMTTFASPSTTLLNSINAA